MRQCSGINLDGKQCTRHPRRDQPTCPHHDRARVEARARARALEPTAAPMLICSGTNLDGKQCTRHPRRGEQTCPHHSPDRVEERACALESTAARIRSVNA